MKNHTLTTVGLLCGAAAMTLIGLPEQLSAREGSISFEKDILPVLDRSCGECHSAQENFSNLRLDTLEDILKGGDLGKVLEPGNPDESSLYVRVSLPQDDLDFMPVEGEPLSEDEVETLRQWIEQGADFGGWTGDS
ncbi:MAG: c-type cytochrome domain-containing protein [Acidobacteriota bacterium]